MTAESTPDRRRDRSDDPLVALHHQLAHARRDAELEAMVLADDAGVVVAGAGAWAVCEELAAYAPLLAKGPCSEGALEKTSRIAELRAHVEVRPVHVAGQTVLLCARGAGALGGRRASIDRAAQGVARILSDAA
ncbi:MAG: hypothetical protein ACREJ3_15355 [Polyangiaceae bacterium]